MKISSKVSREKILKVGDIVWVNLDPTVGDEIKKKRPVVVLNNGHEKHLRLAIVVPVTNWTALWQTNPFFVGLEPSKQNGLKKRSVVDCFQIRAVSHQRILDRLGSVTPVELAQIKKSLALILDLEPEDCE
jgi:mRNA interferase MazF